MFKNLKAALGKFWAVKVAIVVIALFFPLLAKLILADTSGFIIQIAVFILIYSIAASGLDILYGYCGQISMGHAAFFAIGAYGSALLTDFLGLHVLLSALISCAVAAAVSFLISYPAAKLKFHFLSLATIAFGEIIYSLLSASPGEITGNFKGYFPAKLYLFGRSFSDDKTLYFYLVLFFLIIALLAKQAIVNSRTGRGFVAIRENVVAAGGMGINVRKHKVIAFAISAFYVALAGALYGHFVNYISPGLFNYDQSVSFITMLLFGGAGCFWGPITGVTVVQVMNELLRETGEFQQLFYGVLILLVVLFMPNGIINLKLFGRKKKSVKESEVKE